MINHMSMLPDPPFPCHPMLRILTHHARYYANARPQRASAGRSERGRGEGGLQNGVLRRVQDVV